MHMNSMTEKKIDKRIEVQYFIRLSQPLAGELDDATHIGGTFEANTPATLPAG